MFEPPESSSDNTQQIRTPVQPVRVLLLDDEPINLHLRTAILRQRGYECVPAASIEEATELFNNIDIAVLD
jgi:two-component system, OmpR family, response regulator